MHSRARTVVTISIKPAEVDPGGAFEGWLVDVRDLPPLEGGSEAFIKYGEDVRLDALRTFIQWTMQQHGAEALWGRCWWTPELADEIEALEVLLVDALMPVIEINRRPDDWLRRAKRRRRLGNPDIVKQMIGDLR